MTIQEEHDDICRLCNSTTDFKYSDTILNSMKVEYRECRLCRALQTQTPTWLDIAYSPQVHHLGSGSAYRTVWCHALLLYVRMVLGLRGTHIDFGGGSGLLTRFLRDYGVESYIDDKYTENLYAKGYEKSISETSETISAFEVFEHFPNPKTDIDHLFASKPKLLIISTGLYAGQGSDWYYRFPQFGQHVFFWSREAHTYVANKYGYTNLLSGNQLVFYFREKPSIVQRLFLKNQILPFGVKALQCLLPILPKRGSNEWLKH